MKRNVVVGYTSFFHHLYYFLYFFILACIYGCECGCECEWRSWCCRCVGCSASGWPSFRFLSPFWLRFLCIFCGNYTICVSRFAICDLQPAAVAADLSHVCPLNLWHSPCDSINLAHIRLVSDLRLATWLESTQSRGTYSIKRHVTICDLPTKLVSRPSPTPSTSTFIFWLHWLGKMGTWERSFQQISAKIVWCYNDNG